MKSSLHIVSLKSEVLQYIFDNLKDTSTVNFITYRTKPPTFLRNLFQFLVIGRIPLPSFALSLWFDKEFIISLSKVAPQDRLLVIEKINPRILKALAWAVPATVNKYVWLWNPLNTYYIARTSGRRRNGKDTVAMVLNRIKRIGYTICTFDKEDAEKYTLIPRNQLFRFPSSFSPADNHMNADNSTLNDFYFLGQPKSRKKELEDLYELLSSMNFRINFKIVENKSQYITYAENIENIRKSKCVIEINQKQQSGLSLRALEALFFNKKLLTNNEHITSYNFYRPENIFILGKDDVTKLKDFLHTDYKEIPDSIKKEYDVNKWISYFI